MGKNTQRQTMLLVHVSCAVFVGSNTRNTASCSDSAAHDNNNDNNNPDTYQGPPLHSCSHKKAVAYSFQQPLLYKAKAAGACQLLRLQVYVNPREHHSRSAVAGTCAKQNTQRRTNTDRPPQHALHAQRAQIEFSNTPHLAVYQAQPCPDPVTVIVTHMLQHCTRLTLG